MIKLNPLLLVSHRCSLCAPLVTNPYRQFSTWLTDCSGKSSIHQAQHKKLQKKKSLATACNNSAALVHDVKAVQGVSSGTTEQQKKQQKSSQKQPQDTQQLPDALENASSDIIVGEQGQRCTSTGGARASSASVKASSSPRQHSCSEQPDRDRDSTDTCDVHDFMAAWAWKREHLCAPYTVSVRVSALCFYRPES